MLKTRIAAVCYGGNRLEKTKRRRAQSGDREAHGKARAASEERVSHYTVTVRSLGSGPKLPSISGVLCSACWTGSEDDHPQQRAAFGVDENGGEEKSKGIPGAHSGSGQSGQDSRCSRGPRWLWFR